jgi:membrane protease YdiL (CAAX protease family)
VLPQKPAADLLLLALMAGVVLAKVFASLYIRPHDRLPLEVLGMAMWIRTGAFALLSVRRVQGVGFGFWPSLREWKIGAVFFVLMLPVVAALAWWIGLAQFHRPSPPGSDSGNRGALFLRDVVGSGAERGILLSRTAPAVDDRLAAQRMGRTDRDLAPVRRGASAVRSFPQLAFRATGAVAGVFYGLAFRQASSIRASMVTHALTVTTMTVFFS